MPLLEELAMALISVFEGCKLTAYKDSGGVWTIGIGHTGPDVYEGLIIDKDKAEVLLIKDQENALRQINSSQYNFSNIAKAAYVSFGYNCGFSALMRVLSGHDSILNPVHCTDRHGNVLPGLQARRRLEYLLTQF